MSIKNFLKRLISPLLLGKSNIGWQTDLTRVLIECFRGYSEQDWLNVLDAVYPEWQKYVEVKFFSNFAVRDRSIPQAHIYISTWFSIELSELAPELKVVQLIGTGIEFLNDLSTKAKVRIATAAGLPSKGIAEHVLMLMLALDRRLDLAIDRQRSWRWGQNGILENIRCLKGRTVGIVGLGNNGRAIASLASCLDMKVIGFDIEPNLRINDVKICRDLNEIFVLSDFIVLCVPLNDDTRGMIGHEEFKQMKPDTYLINVARGEVIDESALARALKKGIIAGAALDVLPSEPPSFFHPLKGCPNLIITPHLAGNIYTYRAAIMNRFILNVKAFIKDLPLEGSL